MTDRQDASSYVLGYEADMPTLIGVMMRLIVEDRIVEIPSLHARAQCGEGDRTAWGDFYFANDLNQPLLIESFLNFSWESSRAPSELRA